MTNITNFYENLLTSFIIANKKIRNKISGAINGNELVVTIRSKHEGLVNCINATQLYIKPFAAKPHHIDLCEILVGYDEEGSHWSDNMGGRIIDCTGKNVKGAIEVIVAEMNNRI